LLIIVGGLLHVIFSVIGIVSVLFVISVFVRYNSTPIIMASGRELCYVLMVGMLLCYAMTFVQTRSLISRRVRTVLHFIVFLPSSLTS